MCRSFLLLSFTAILAAMTVVSQPQPVKAAPIPGWFFDGDKLWMKHWVCVGEGGEWVYTEIPNGGEVTKSQFQTASLIPTAVYGPPVRSTPTVILWWGSWRLERQTGMGDWELVYNLEALTFNQDGVAFCEKAPFNDVPAAGMYRATFLYVGVKEDGTVHTHDEDDMTMTFLVTP